MRRKASRSEAFVKEIIQATFPEYKGRKITISTSVPQYLDSYWSEGSRQFFKFYQPATKKTYTVKSNHPVFESSNPNYLASLPADIICVSHTIFCGHDMGITIYVTEPDFDSLSSTVLQNYLACV